MSYNHKNTVDNIFRSELMKFIILELLLFQTKLSLYKDDSDQRNNEKIVVITINDSNYYFSATSDNEYKLHFTTKNISSLLKMFYLQNHIENEKDITIKVELKCDKIGENIVIKVNDKPIDDLETKACSLPLKTMIEYEFCKDNT